MYVAVSTVNCVTYISGQLFVILKLAQTRPNFYNVKYIAVFDRFVYTRSSPRDAASQDRAVRLR